MGRDGCLTPFYQLFIESQKDLTEEKKLLDSGLLFEDSFS
ncbi:hypothetical protein LCGC14_2926950, partial [marine sediment metagenome]